MKGRFSSLWLLACAVCVLLLCGQASCQAVGQGVFVLPAACSFNGTDSGPLCQGIPAPVFSRSAESAAQTGSAVPVFSCTSQGWEAAPHGPVFADANLNITICGGNVVLRNTLVVPPSSNLIFRANGTLTVTGGCLMAYGPLQFNFDTVEYEQAFSSPEFLRYDCTPGGFNLDLRKSGRVLTERDPCADLDVTELNSTSPGTYRFTTTYNNACEDDQDTFVKIVAPAGAVLLFIILVYCIVVIVKTMRGGDEDED